MANLLLHDNLMSTLLATIEPGNIMAPESNSTFAHWTDLTRLIIDLITLVFFVAIIAVMVYFALKYRRTDDRVHSEKTSTHNTALELSWTLPPLVIVLVLFWMGFVGYWNMVSVPEDAYEIQVTAKKWSWNFTHPNGYQSTVLDVPAGRNVKLVMRSDDVLHSLYVPAFRVKKDVVPGRYSTLWFQAVSATPDADVPTPDEGDELDGLARENLTVATRTLLTNRQQDAIRGEVQPDIEKAVAAERTEEITEKQAELLRAALVAANKKNKGDKKLTDAEIDAEVEKQLPEAVSKKLVTIVEYRVRKVFEDREAETNATVDKELKAAVDAAFAELDVPAKQKMARDLLDQRAIAKGHILFCAEYCGNSHSDMIAKVVVHHKDWKAPPFGKGKTQLELGKLLFGVKGCRGCHADEAGMASQCPPLFNGPTNRDENYLRESILNPGAVVVQGYQNNMPVIQMSDEHVDAIIAYIKTLGAPQEEAASAAEASE